MWRGKAEGALRAVTPTSFLLLLFRACNGPGLATARKMWAACCIFCSPPLYHWTSASLLNPSLRLPFRPSGVSFCPVTG